ncbi:MAG TPA: VOC family protein [Steroidobacteraceae bacterium]|nr:VOC family protein [Steroidobacteraceae bacterium]
MSGRLRAIVAFRLTTAMPDRLVQFYESIGFSAGPPRPVTPADMALLELEGRGTRIALGVGGQRIDLESFDRKGRPYPENVSAADLCFQHFALVTRDAAAAWERARAHGASPISTEGPVTLPASAGGVTAVKLRDPEGHPLEFLQFPAAAGGPGYRECVLGIDHSAISVADAGVSRRFYEALGLRADRPTLNDGPTQVALDGVPDVRVDVVPMSPEIGTPHLELLGYRHPIGRPAVRLSANDVAATRIVWRSDRDALLRDPDGHLHVSVR